jgi:hypothetical protein
MGWPASVTLSHTSWEFHAAWLGWSKFNCPAPTPKGMTHAELDAIRREYGI